jgi:threonylcarbamoyladenosine tRNA methylthiotransferase MtaB
MRRRYTADDVERILTEIETRLPGSFVGMDLIVGFPGETEAEFQETYERLSRTPWTRIHVFPYSERPGTKALKLEDSVPVQVRTRRSQLVRELSSARYLERAARAVGRMGQGLVLGAAVGKDGSNEIESPLKVLTKDYWSVRIKPQDLARGTEVNVKMVRFVAPKAGRMDGWFEGEVAL